MMKRKGYICLILCTVVVTMTGCFNRSNPKKDTMVPEDKIQIGYSFDSFVIERWQKDRDVFVAEAKKLGANVNVQNANGDVEEQKAQIQYFIDKKVDVIVVVAVDSEACSDVLKKARDAGIKVIAYDRLLRKINADLYISFDNEEVGRLMAKTLVSKVPAGGNIITVFGSTADNNVQLLEKGFKEVIEKSDLNRIYSTYAEGWLAEKAFSAVNEGLKITKEIDGIMCGNDDLASQAVLALSENRMAGKVVVTGQDADLAACQRIVEGTQTMTVYKPVDILAKSAAEYAVKLAKNEKLDGTDTINDGKYDIPYVKLQPIAVTKENMDEVIIGDGFHLKEEVYLNVRDK